MKYLFAILLSFIIITPAYAAKTVSGSVPVVSPLQPIPTDVAPNVNENIQFHDASHEGQFDANGNVVTGQGLAGSGDETGSSSGKPGNSEAPINSKGTGAFVGWIIVLLALIALAWLWYKQRKNPL